MPLFCTPKTVDVVQSVRTSDCGSEGRGFEPHLPPDKSKRLCTIVQPFPFKGERRKAKDKNAQGSGRRAQKAQSIILSASGTSYEHRKIPPPVPQRLYKQKTVQAPDRLLHMNEAPRDNNLPQNRSSALMKMQREL